MPKKKGSNKKKNYGPGINNKGYLTEKKKKKKRREKKTKGEKKARAKDRLPKVVFVKKGERVKKRNTAGGKRGSLAHKGDAVDPKRNQRGKPREGRRKSQPPGL